MKLTLIGFMGAGKSTVAKMLAEKLKCPHYEVDEMILTNSNRKSISEIFDLDGEGTFREFEREAIRSLAQVESGVISTGGGAVLSEDNLDSLRSNGGKFLYLEASFGEIINRLRTAEQERPLFRDPSKAAILFGERIPVYEQIADWTLSTDGRKPAEIAAFIDEIVNAGRL
ncbi:MAG: shikimate kinase [Bdellovibrionales bacterium]|nr:shikimate kinase [Bdellovibrionales bacterium]